jgi:hypothetical protein
MISFTFAINFGTYLPHVPNTIYQCWVVLDNCEPVSTLVPVLKTSPGSGLVPVNPQPGSLFIDLQNFTKKEKIKMKNSTIK